MSLLIDVAVAAESIVQAAWNRAAANRERLRRRLDVQAVREKANLNTINRRNFDWEQKYTTPTPVQYRPDEPAAYPGKGEELSFVLPPGLVFDSGIVGPFAVGWRDGLVWDYINGALMCQVKGYRNQLVTSARIKVPSSANDIDFDVRTDAKPTLYSDGSYQSDEVVVTPRISITTGNRFEYDANNAVLYLSHVIAQGTEIRTVTDETRWKYYENGAPLAKVPGLPAGNGITFEVLVFFASGAAQSGLSALNVDIIGTASSIMTPQNALLYLGFSASAAYRLPGDAPLFLPSGWSPSGGYQHFAYVVDANEFRIYVDGQLIQTDPSPFPDVVKVRIWDVSVLLSDADRVLIPFNDHSPFPGKSRINGFRFTGRVLYTGSSFTPPTELTSLA